MNEHWYQYRTRASDGPARKWGWCVDFDSRDFFSLGDFYRAVTADFEVRGHKHDAVMVVITQLNNGLRREDLVVDWREVLKEAVSVRPLP